MHQDYQKQEIQTVDRTELLQELRKARSRSEAVDALQRADRHLAENPEDIEIAEAREQLGDREEKRYFSKYYMPTVLVAFLILGSLSDQRAISFLAAVVVAAPAALVVWGATAVLRWMVTGELRA